MTTLDGVTSLNLAGQPGGGEISGLNLQDRLLMGLLRAVSDAVVVGSGTLRAVPRHLWTATRIYPPLKDTFQALRAQLGKSEHPLNVIVTSQGHLDLDLPVFRSAEVPTLIVSAPAGQQRLLAHDLPPRVRLAVGRSGTDLAVTAADVLAAIGASPGATVLVEGGPQLLSHFLAEHLLDELFLTLAPQIAGRDPTVERPGLVAGKLFAPGAPIWSTLASLKRGGSHLFLRYAL